MTRVGVGLGFVWHIKFTFRDLFWHNAAGLNRPAPVAINQPDATRRQFARVQFSRTLDYAARAGAHHVTTLPGVTFDGETPADSWQRALDELHWRVERVVRILNVRDVELIDG